MKKTYLNDIKSDIEFWTRIQCSQVFQVEKQGSRGYLFYDNFFILNYCLTTDIHDISIYESELNFSVSKKLTDSQIKSYAFNEIIFFITRYKGVLNLVDCYQQLKRQLSEDDCIRLFNSVKLTTKVFVNLIGLSEAGYYNSHRKTPLEESYDE